MPSRTPDIIPIGSRFRGQLLEPSQLETMKRGTLRLLDEVGVHVPLRRALEIFADHGARVNWDEQIVQIPPDVVQEAMATAPRSFVLGGREERFDMTLDGKNTYLCTDGTGVEVVDLVTRERRASRKEDVVMMARVCDALPMLSFYWPPVSAQDHGPTAPLHQCHAGLTNTLKHVRGGMTIAPPLAEYAVEMATVVAGSEEERRQRPPICTNICTIAPLAHDDDGLATALTYGEAGIPTSFMAMPTMGSTAPATPLGALVVGDAEAVSGMVLLQLAYPGCPVFHSIETSLMHPRTGGYIGGVPLPLGMVAVELAHAWGVPSLGGSGLSTDAAGLGWKTGSDAGWGAALLPLYGGEVCGYMGLVEGSMVLHPEKVLLDHELCRDAYDLAHGLHFDESEMALDVIREVGPRGHFLAQPHTREHIRDFRLSKLFHEHTPEGKPRDPREAALEEFRRIYETHEPKPLHDDVLDELDCILEAAEREAAAMGDG